MPCTRSMRSKTSKEVEQVEVKSPPRTRATRTRKGTKREDPSTSDVPKSPATSVGSSSTRSGRTRTRAKVQPVEVEEIVEASSPSPSPPPRARVTRPAKKKTAKGSKSKGTSKRKQKEVKNEDEEENYEEQVPLIPHSPEKLQEEEEEEDVVVAPVTVTKKNLNNNLPNKQIASGSAMGLATSQAKKKPHRKVRGNEKEEEFDIESTDDDLEEVRQRTHKTLTLEELHKHFLNPFRTALQAVEVYPKFMERIMDTESVRKQEEKFQELLKRNAMPPPPPKTKGKGRTRKKRARSPEKTPSALEVPESFNFVPAPAKKKMIMDVAAVGVAVEKAAGNNSQTASNSTADDNSKTASVSTAELSLSAPKIDKAKNMVTDSKANKKNAPTPALVDKVHGNAEPKSAEDDKVRQEKKTSEATESPPSCETPKDTTKDSKESNEEFTPELFVVESPKLGNADRTIVISKKDSSNSGGSNFEDKNKTINTPTSSIIQPSSAIGVVSSLVNFFSKSKKEGSAQEKSEVPVAPKSVNKKETSGEKVLTIEDILSDSIIEILGPTNNDPNATYVVPPVNSGEKKNSPESMLNVTVCVKASPSKTESVPTKNVAAPTAQVPQPILPKNSKFLDKQDSPVSRSFIKDPPLAILQEEDEAKDDRTSNKSEIARQPPSTKVTNKTDSKKGVSSSSSSSSASMKSASSQPCLTGIGKKPPASASKNAPNYASTGKLHEVARSKPLEDAEKRRKEFMQQKHENNKKKLEDWKKKTEKTKLEHKLEEERKLKEKQKLMQTASSSNLLKKPFPALKPQPASTAALVKPQLFGQNKFPSVSVKPINAAAGPSSFKPPTSKPHVVYKPPPPPVEVDLDDSFKSANASTNSFLDTTGDAQLSSYDITIYEDLDEDLKHRENKTVPKWASNKDSLTVALFSMIYLPECHNKFSGTFPKPDKTYKLFPDK